MQITILGYILIPLSAILFIIKPDALFYLMVFFSTFLAASVINVEPITFGLQPAYMFGILWIVHLLYKYIRRPPIIDSRTKVNLIMLGLLWTAALLSLNMPLIFRYKILVHGPSDIWGFKPLDLSLTNFTQFLYMTFVLVITTFTMIEVRDIGMLVTALKTLLFSASFAVVWGFCQMFCFYTGIKYPYFLFNNNIGSAQLWNQTAGGLPRVSSVLTEPAAYSSLLLMVLPLIIILWKNRIYLVGKLYLDLMLGCFFTTIILTTSTTAYVGFIFMIILMLIFTFFFRRASPEPVYTWMSNKKAILEYFRVLAIAIMFLAAVGIVFLSAFQMDMDRFMALLRSMTIEKASSHSGMERAEGFANGIRILLESRLMGVGWGSNRTFDLGTTLLSNIGVIGFTAFLLVFWRALANCSRVYRTSENFILSSISIALLFSVVTVLFIMFISGPDIIFLCFWIVTGIALSLKEADPPLQGLLQLRKGELL